MLHVMDLPDLQQSAAQVHFIVVVLVAAPEEIAQSQADLLG